MNRITKRSFSFLLALALCMSLLAGVHLPQAEAATYVANWGTRGEEATELSSYAVSFYQKAGVTYSGLSSLSGSSTEGLVPGSSLFKQLQNIMETYHTHETDYDETKDLYKYTDCQNGNTKYITCIWCGEQYDGAWPYGGDPWNREHTWPKSKSLDGNDPDVDQVDEEDIMLLRPACKGENSSHGNKPYGSTTNETYFYPNINKGYGYDVRGDLARTLLYVYVRYGNASYMFGSTGVIQSQALLLQWMEQDPVDTWEMGRNDSVQSITGTRNIFIDYPELAFKLFNKSVPANYPTPSGGVDDSTGETVTVKFMENGSLTTNLSVTSSSAFTFPSAKNAAPSGYSFVGWVTGTVSETTARPSTIHTPGDSALAGNRTYHALYTKVDSTQTGSDYVLHTGAITEGDYLFVAANGAMTTAANGSADRRDAIPVTITNNTIYSPEAALIWHIAPIGDYYTFYNAEAKQYAAANGTKNQLVMSSTVNDYAKWSISGNVITNKGNQAESVNYTLRRNGNYGFACYAASTGSAPTLYKAATGAVIYTTTVQGAACQHTSTYISGKVNATCTNAGYTGDTYCFSCGKKLSTGSTVAMLNHNYVNGSCSACGTADPNAPSVDPDIPAGSYVKVTTTPTSWEGTYLIVYENGKTANVFNGQDAINGYITASISNNIISGSNTLDAVAVKIESMTGGYAIKINNKYLSGTSGSNNLNFNDTQQLNTIKLDDDNTVLITSNTSVLRFNSTSSQLRFRYYKSATYDGQKAICLYKLVTAPEAPKVAQVGDTQYESFAEAYAAANGQPIKLLANLGSDKVYYALTLTQDVTIDLNGYYGYLSATGNYTVYGMDSQTLNYDTEDYGALYTNGATVAAASGYLDLTDSDSIHSFHAYEFAITHISLQPNADALGFKAQILGDDQVQSAVTGYGFHIGAQLNVTKSKTGTPTDGAFTLRLKNIMAVGGGEAEITASAFVVIRGQTLETQIETTSMKDTLITINSIWNRLNTTQQNAVKALYNQHSTVMAPWLGDDNKIA